MSKEQKIVLISYFPLFNPTNHGFTSGNQFEFAKLENTVFKILEDLPSVTIRGVLWTYHPIDDNVNNEDKTMMPVFLTENAADVANHLRFWCEEEYDMFELFFEQRKEGYAVMLHPNPMKSIERYNRHQRYTNREETTEDDFLVIYNPIVTCCPNGTTYQQYESVIKNQRRCFVGFLELDKFNNDSPNETNTDDIVIIGPFEIGDSKKFGVHFDRIWLKHAESN